MTAGRIPSVEGGIQPTLLTTKGDLISATAASTVARLGVGSDAQILVADSSASTGLAYKGVGVANGLTTTGDTIYSSSGTTQSRLGIGSTGQVLTVASGIPSWSTPSSGALTFIRRSSFSSVATTTTTFDGIFTSTYKVYIVIVESMFSSTDQGILQLQFRVGATTKNGANYSGQAFGYDRSNTLVTRGQIATTLFSICELATGTNTALANITFDFVGNSSQNPVLNGTFNSIRQSVTAGVLGAYYADPDTMTGLIFSASAGNITGTVSVYGLATS